MFASPWLQRIGSSGLVLILANCIPLCGVLFFGWDVFALMLQFWFENVVIGVFALLRIATAGQKTSIGGRLFLALFFTLHYGGFTLGHGYLLLELFGTGSYDMDQMFQPEFWLALIAQTGIAIALVALFASHLYSFVVNYLLAGEFRRMAPRKAMSMPYPRIILLHLSLLGGGFLLEMTGQPLAGLAIFVLLKIGLDLSLHRREHRQLQDGQ
ncbi:MAG: DUF6498-containing protein [Gammaproteobacteria bacterium]